MGALAIDIHKQEREFKHLTLSDINVVKYLILYRNKVDVTYGANTNIDINSAGDMFEFNQELVCLYASLDNVIGKIELNEKELKLLNLIFEGNTIADVINVYELYPKKTAYRTLNRIIDNIVLENNKQWKEVLNNTVLSLDKK
ncbi:MAG: hypothetical protein ABS939_18050 [Psychrobacillus sp.]